MEYFPKRDLKNHLIVSYSFRMVYRLMM